MTARELASSLGLPLERIDGEFINHRSADLDTVVHPGDRVAFVPLGTPASHPAFFGPFIIHEGPSSASDVSARTTSPATLGARPPTRSERDG